MKYIRYAMSHIVKSVAAMIRSPCSNMVTSPLYYYSMSRFQYNLYYTLLHNRSRDKTIKSRITAAEVTFVQIFVQIFVRIYLALTLDQSCRGCL
jgi:hypothetical protein